MGAGDAPLPLLVAIACSLAAAGAWQTGQAIAESWRPLWQILPAALLLTLTYRFLDYALFAGTLLSGKAALVTLAIVVGLAAASFRMRQARKMVSQYPWLYRRAGPFHWREIRR